MSNDLVVVEETGFLSDCVFSGSIGWDIMMTFFKYPFPAFMRNVQFITIDRGDHPKAFPYRATLKTPVYNPTLTTHRMCPNFPHVCVDIHGDVQPVLQPENNKTTTRARDLSALTVRFEKYGDYIYIPVPGRNHPQFVSRLQIYGDAWAAPVDNPQERYQFAPKDGNYSNLTPDNIVRVLPWKKGKLEKYKNCEHEDGVTFENSMAVLGKKHLTEALDKSQVNMSGHSWWNEDCVYGACWTIHKKRYGTSIDWCFNQYWGMGIISRNPKEAHPLVYCGTSWRELEVNSGVPVKILKQLYKSQDKNSNPLVFKL